MIDRSANTTISPKMIGATVDSMRGDRAAFMTYLAGAAKHIIFTAV